MKNVDELYEKYYTAYKNDYDNDDELSEAKKEKVDYKKFKWFDKTDKKSKLDGETKKDEESNLTALPKWLHSKNDFKEAIKLKISGLIQIMLNQVLVIKSFLIIWII